MKSHGYKLRGKDIPVELVGRVVTQRKPESVEDFKTLVEDANEGRILALATQQWLLHDQRGFKDVAESDEVRALVTAGKVEEAFKLVQKASDEYIDGGRKPGKPSEARNALAEKRRLQEAAKSNPKVRAMLESLGIAVG